MAQAELMINTPQRPSDAVYKLAFKIPSIGEKEVLIGRQMSFGSSDESDIQLVGVKSIANSCCSFIVHNKIMSIHILSKAQQATIGKNKLEAGKMYILDSGDEVKIGSVTVRVGELSSKEEIEVDDEEIVAVAAETDETDETESGDDELSFELNEEEPPKKQTKTTSFKPKEMVIPSKIKQKPQSEDPSINFEVDITQELALNSNASKETVRDEEESEQVEKKPVNKFLFGRKSDSKDDESEQESQLKNVDEEKVDTTETVQVSESTDTDVTLKDKKISIQAASDAPPSILRAVAFVVNLFVGYFFVYALLPLIMLDGIFSSIISVVVDPIKAGIGGGLGSIAGGFVHFYIGYAIFDIFANLGLGVSFSHFIAGIRSDQDDPKTRMVKGVIRSIVGVFTLPLDYVVFTNKPTIKEKLSKSYLIYERGAKNIVIASVGLPAVLLATLVLPVVNNLSHLGGFIVVEPPLKSIGKAEQSDRLKGEIYACSVILNSTIPKNLVMIPRFLIENGEVVSSLNFYDQATAKSVGISFLKQNFLANILTETSVGDPALPLFYSTLSATLGGEEYVATADEELKKYVVSSLTTSTNLLANVTSGNLFIASKIRFRSKLLEKFESVGEEITVLKLGDMDFIEVKHGGNSTTLIPLSINPNSVTIELTHNNGADQIVSQVLSALFDKSKWDFTIENSSKGKIKTEALNDSWNVFTAINVISTKDVMSGDINGNGLVSFYQRLSSRAKSDQKDEHKSAVKKSISDASSALAMYMQSKNSSPKLVSVKKELEGLVASIGGSSEEQVDVKEKEQVANETIDESENKAAKEKAEEERAAKAAKAALAEEKRIAELEQKKLEEEEAREQAEQAEQEKIAAEKEEESKKEELNDDRASRVSYDNRLNPESEPKVERVVQKEVKPVVVKPAPSKAVPAPAKPVAIKPAMVKPSPWPTAQATPVEVKKVAIKKNEIKESDNKQAEDKELFKEREHKFNDNRFSTGRMAPPPTETATPKKSVKPFAQKTPAPAPTPAPVKEVKKKVAEAEEVDEEEEESDFEQKEKKRKARESRFSTGRLAPPI